ncbi:MAG: tetratricopeptide repeat protein [Desulfosalsimonadaceae bacterium]
MGHTALQLKQYDQAIQAHAKAIAVLQEIRVQDGQDENLEAEGELRLSLGQAYRHSDQAHEAIQCYERAEKIAEALHNPEMKYRAVGNRGLIYADTGHYSESITLLTGTLEYYKRINDHRLLGHAQFNLAYAHYRKGDLVKAKAIGAEALRYLTMINDSYKEEVKRQIDTWEKKPIESDKA